MKKLVKTVSALAVVMSLCFASSMLAAPVVPYLYVYSVVGGTPFGQAQATLVEAVAGADSTVGLPKGSLPQTIGPTDSSPLIVQNGTQSGAVSATLTYNLVVGPNKSTCTVNVSTSDVGDKTKNDAKATVTGDSGDNGLCTSFLVPVYSFNPQDGDQVITLNWKSSF
ncbi:MAG: hypothetical protein ACD_42C00457G0001 [uncultured bacterium]|nr:MAG: hypothetical protein ACD_42C00457G0001 [uncultured bacterium]OGT50599.1 MAG: hypothetical protein A3E53_03680 [Gammaproteobacteria bacterium RIFCSPHIGHO2_12_FULL_39_24]